MNDDNQEAANYELVCLVNTFVIKLQRTTYHSQKTISLLDDSVKFYKCVILRCSCVYLLRILPGLPDWAF